MNQQYDLEAKKERNGQMYSRKHPASRGTGKTLVSLLLGCINCLWHVSDTLGGAEFQGLVWNQNDGKQHCSSGEKATVQCSKQLIKMGVGHENTSIWGHVSYNYSLPQHEPFIAQEVLALSKMI
jgi:hypothetical protein